MQTTQDRRHVWVLHVPFWHLIYTHTEIRSRFTGIIVALSKETSVASVAATLTSLTHLKARGLSRCALINYGGFLNIASTLNIF